MEPYSWDSSDQVIIVGNDGGAEGGPTTALGYPVQVLWPSRRPSRQPTRLPEHRQVRFRIAVHLGDVMVKEGDLFGEGVNIAARLQTLAAAEGYVFRALCMSCSSLDLI